METWTGEELRRAALDALGAGGDERARDVLAHASLSLTHAVSRWEGSAGAVAGHRVTLSLDAARLGALRATPAIVDALLAALAAAAATRPGEALADTRLCWSRARAPRHAAYRDAPPDHGAMTLAEGLVAYLGAAGEAELARLVGAGAVEESAGGATLVVPRVERESLRFDPRARAAIDAAVRDLLGPRSRLLGVRPA